MRYLICLILCLLFVPKLQASQIQAKDIDRVTVKQAIDEAVGEIVITDDPPNMNSELALALRDLQQLPEQERSSMKYFTLYSAAHNGKLLQKLYLELIFWTNSLSSEGFFAIPQPVEGSATLFRVDIRDYGWTEEAWEKLSVLEPYIKEPWANYEIVTALRIESGNVLVRADWFIDATSSPNKQILNGIDEILYYTLLYAKTGAPKTLDEYYIHWGIDKEKIENKVQTIKQILIKSGESGVAHHNRMLAYSGIELGYHYESSDFLTSNGKQNVLDNLAPGVFAHPARDAAEHITSMKNGLQTYFVTNKDNKRLDVVDPNIASDKTAILPIIQVRSCVTCHEEGINAAINKVKSLLTKKINLYVANKEEYLNMKRTYDRDLEINMSQDSDSYNAAVQNCNGLTAKENAAAFREVLDWYNKPLDAAQCARECGVTKEEYIKKIENSPSSVLLDTATGGTITRDEWENPKGGYFSQAMLTIMGAEGIRPVLEEKPAAVELVAPERVLYVKVIMDSPLMMGKKRIMTVKRGDSYKVVAQQGEWYHINIDGVTGWLHRKDVVEELK